MACNCEGRPASALAVSAVAHWAAERGVRLVPVCPEVAGGLTTPRVAAERGVDGIVVTAAGDDVSDAYRRGADAAVALAGAIGATHAILKARSPSCGCSGIYDGTFSHHLVPGRGVTAEALIAAGVTVRSEEDLAEASQ